MRLARLPGFAGCALPSAPEPEPEPEPGALALRPFLFLSFPRI